MLERLYVKNLALIDEVEVDLKEGFNVLTGETGAGKSIVIDSISFALGEKVDKKMVRNPENPGFVEIVFSELSEEVIKRIKELDEDLDLSSKEIALSRKITDTKSTARINGETVTATKLKQVAAFLIDVHGQHEHQSLLFPAKHLDYLDSFCGEEAEEIKVKLKGLYKDYKEAVGELEELDSNPMERERELSFLKYEASEIEAANLKEGEDEELEKKYKLMINSKKIVEGLSSVKQYMGDGGASDMISRALREIGSVRDFDKPIEELESTLYTLDDIASGFIKELNSYVDTMTFDAEDFAATEERLDEINHLKSKYGDSIKKINESLLERQKKIEELENFDETIKRLNDKIKKLEEKVFGCADKLSKIRKKKAYELCERMKESLLELNFLDVIFESEFTKKEVSANGYDEFEFMISLNPGEALRPLKDVASGGELSRIMLALKSVLSENDEIGTLIFDEIDTGISGRTAQMVAKKLHTISLNHQVICITHLPQIAATCDEHFYIEKNVKDNKTVTTVERLDYDGSIRELSRMLSGDVITEAVLENARQLKANNTY